MIRLGPLVSLCEVCARALQAWVGPLEITCIGVLSGSCDGCSRSARSNSSLAVFKLPKEPDAQRR